MSNRPPDAQERARFTQQLDAAFEDASKLAGSSLAPADFYQKFLNRTLGAIDAPAGAVWLRTPQGFLQVAAQQNLEKVGLDDKRGGRQCHNEVLRQIFQATPPRPVLLEPQGRLGAGPVEPGGVPAANLTNFYALFAPIVGPEKQSLGLLEVFQESTHDPRLYQTFLQYTLQMAGYASQYHSFTGNRSVAGSEKAYSQVEGFARLIHTTLNPTECAYHVANEGRKLLEADRLCVGIRHGGKTTVEAVSGADVVEKASTHVRRMRALFDAVLKYNDKLVFRGTRDDSLPPPLLKALDDYLAESQPKLLVVTPVRDDREKDADKPARSALLAEVFNPPDDTDPLLQRLEVVGKHAASALYNAAEMKRIPFKPLWWPVVKLQDGLGGKGKLYTLLALLGIAILVGVMVLVPWPLKLAAKGQYLPEHMRMIYPPAVGDLRDVILPGQADIKQDYPVVKLFNKDLGKELTELNEAILTLGKKIDAMQTDRKPGDDLKPKLDLAEAEAQRDSAIERRKNLIARNNLIESEAGFFVAKAPQLPQFGGKELRWANISGSDAREKMMSQVQPTQPILRLGAVDGPWRVEIKIPQRAIGHVQRAFANDGDNETETDPNNRYGGKTGKYIPVDILFGGFETERFPGRLYESEVSIEAQPNKDDHNETEPVTLAYARVDLPDDKRELFKKAGAEVRVNLVCGNRPLGYSMFHGVWEWFYEKVVFFF